MEREVVARLGRMQARGWDCAAWPAGRDYRVKVRRPKCRSGFELTVRPGEWHWVNFLLDLMGAPA